MKKHPIKKWLKSSSKISLIILVLVWLISLGALIHSFILGDWLKIGLSSAALVLYLVPFVLYVAFKITLPEFLEISLYLFVFAGLIIGEVFAIYGPFPYWDIILHTLSGFLLASVGFMIAGAMNHRKLAKRFILLFALCFSITLGSMWECVEFSFDQLTRTDAQKDTHIHNISTITLQRDGGSNPIKINDIQTTDLHLANGETVTIDEGFLDIGLIDTMKDIFIDAVGASIFCIFGLFYLKDKHKFKFIDNLVVKR